MSGFFPHTGGSPSGYSALPQSTFATVLDDIVADVTAQAGTNGWSVWDDQRTGYTPLVMASNTGGMNNAPTGIVFNATSAITQNTYGRFKRNWIVNSSQISVDQTNWYTIAAAASQVAATLDRNFTGTAATYHLVYEKSGPYIVLKCTSSQKSFYVLIVRPVSYGVSLRIQIFETWNAATHTGTNGGPMEELRAFESGPTTSMALQYVLFLLPDVFAIWAGGDQTYTSGVPEADFFYAGNLNPLRVGDNTCLLQACSNQDFSGIYVSSSPNYSSANTWNGGAACFRNIAGQLWINPTSQYSFGGANAYVVAPRGLNYIWGIDRTNLDDAGKFQFCEMDAYWGGPYGSGFDKNEGKRGELRYLKTPVMNPTGLHLASLGPADDGNTYMLMRVTYPQQTSALISTYLSDGAYNVNVACGFAFCTRNGAVGEVNNSTSGALTYVNRWFMMPINL